MAATGEFGRAFTATQLSKETGDVLAAASVAPIMIVKHQKPRYVVMSTERYKQMLRGRPSPRRSFHIDDMPEDEVEQWVTAADAFLSEGRGD